jgi:hypothetical protein
MSHSSLHDDPHEDHDPTPDLGSQDRSPTPNPPGLYLPSDDSDGPQSVERDASPNPDPTHSPEPDADAGLDDAKAYDRILWLGHQLQDYSRKNLIRKAAWLDTMKRFQDWLGDNAADDQNVSRDGKFLKTLNPAAGKRGPLENAFKELTSLLSGSPQQTSPVGGGGSNGGWPRQTEDPQEGQGLVPEGHGQNERLAQPEPSQERRAFGGDGQVSIHPRNRRPAPRQPLQTPIPSLRPSPIANRQASPPESPPASATSPAVATATPTSRLASAFGVIGRFATSALDLGPPAPSPPPPHQQTTKKINVGVRFQISMETITGPATGEKRRSVDDEGASEEEGRRVRARARAREGENAFQRPPGPSAARALLGEQQERRGRLPAREGPAFRRLGQASSWTARSGSDSNNNQRGLPRPEHSASRRPPLQSGLHGGEHQGRQVGNSGFRRLRAYHGAGGATQQESPARGRILGSVANGEDEELEGFVQEGREDMER